jgi:hypothetical protein
VKPAPFSLPDIEWVADIQELTTKRMRALVRESPVASLSCAVAGGYLLGGGWRTSLGRLLLAAARRYVAVKALERCSALITSSLKQ